MNFVIHPSYNMDLLNLMNVLTDDDLYTDRHPGVSKRFGEPLSQDAKRRLREAVVIKRNAMLGPDLCVWLSGVPEFETEHVVAVFSDLRGLRRHFSQCQYRDELTPKAESIIELLVPVIAEVEAAGFRAYWQAECLPQIERYRAELQTIVDEFNLAGEIEWWLGSGQAPESVTLYLGSLAAPHGIKICGPRYISDVSFDQKDTLTIALHEMFHPPYNAGNLADELQTIGAEPFFRQAHAAQNPKYRYASIEGFIEENVVEAMSILSAVKLGLAEGFEVLDYFATHDDGSHVLSVILYDAFSRYPKTPDQSFEGYFRDLVKKLPVGSFEVEYKAIQERGL